MRFNAHFLTRYILKSGKFPNINHWFLSSDFIKRISSYGCYGYNRLKRTSVVTIAPPLVDSKHYNSSPFSPIWVDPLWCARIAHAATSCLLGISWIPHFVNNVLFFICASCPMASASQTVLWNHAFGQYFPVFSSASALIASVGSIIYFFFLWQQL